MARTFHWSTKVSFDEFERLLMTIQPDPRCPGPDCPSKSLRQDLIDSGYWCELCFEVDAAVGSADPAATMGYFAAMYGSQEVYESLSSELGSIVLQMCTAYMEPPPAEGWL